ncbi:MAG: adenosylcobinamide amidohydrolase [Candidatus Bathyarchaeia archaeon]
MKEWKTSSPIGGCRIRMAEDVFILEVDEPIRTLSSAVLNGGLVDAASMINLQVPRSFKGDPHAVLLQKARRLRLRAPTVGFMTAVDMRRLAVCTHRFGGRVLSAYVTAGVSHPAAAGDQVTAYSHGRAGTINIFLLVDGNLTDGCLVNAVQTAVEAKTATLRNLKVRSRFSKKTATGTVTDAIGVACTGRGREISYAGTATNLGQTIAKAVMEGIERSLGFKPRRSMLGVDPWLSAKSLRDEEGPHETF